MVMMFFLLLNDDGIDGNPSTFVLQLNLMLAFAQLLGGEDY